MVNRNQHNVRTQNQSNCTKETDLYPRLQVLVVLFKLNIPFFCTPSSIQHGYDFGALVTSDAITPTRSDSKILIQCVMYMASSNGSGRFGYRVMRVPVGGSATHITPTQYGDGVAIDNNSDLS